MSYRGASCIRCELGVVLEQLLFCTRMHALCVHLVGAHTLLKATNAMVWSIMHRGSCSAYATPSAEVLISWVTGAALQKYVHAASAERQGMVAP